MSCCWTAALLVDTGQDDNSQICNKMPSLVCREPLLRSNDKIYLCCYAIALKMTYKMKYYWVLRTLSCHQPRRPAQYSRESDIIVPMTLTPQLINSANQDGEKSVIIVPPRQNHTLWRGGDLDSINGRTLSDKAVLHFAWFLNGWVRKWQFCTCL